MGDMVHLTLWAFSRICLAAFNLFNKIYQINSAPKITQQGYEHS
jgi:uncharacterized BrkB/YihY/UPF0761 family membrane protein